MEFSGIAMISALGMLACPLVMLIAAVGRFVPWRTWMVKVCGSNAQAAS